MIEPFAFSASARLIDFMRQADEPGLINLAAGVPGLEALPSAALAEAFQAAVLSDGARLFAYHHPEGDHQLRELLAERLQMRGAKVRGQDLFTVSGCTQGLSVLISVLIEPGDVVAVEAPAYYGLLELLGAAKARVLPLPLVEDFEASLEALARCKPRCLIVCSSLSNPSGATLSESQREQLVELGRAKGIRIIEDDIYGELVDGGAPKPMLAFDDGATVAYVTSFSKSVSPGLRVGACVPGTLFDQASARKCQQDLHSAVPTEAALRHFLASGAMEPHLEGLRIRNARRRQLVLAAIERSFPAGYQVRPPAGGYMLWVELARKVDLQAAKKLARAEQVAFAGGEVFYAQAPERSALRLNCAKASESELERAIAILGRILSDLSAG